jgi:hypothetical protein
MSAVRVNSGTATKRPPEDGHSASRSDGVTRSALITTAMRHEAEAAEADQQYRQCHRFAESAVLRPQKATWLR